MSQQFFVSGEQLAINIHLRNLINIFSPASPKFFFIFLLSFLNSSVRLNSLFGINISLPFIDATLVGFKVFSELGSEEILSGGFFLFWKGHRYLITFLVLVSKQSYLDAENTGKSQQNSKHYISSFGCV